MYQNRLLNYIICIWKQEVNGASDEISFCTNKLSISDNIVYCVDTAMSCKPNKCEIQIQNGKNIRTFD